MSKPIPAPVYLIEAALLNASGCSLSDLHGPAPEPQPVAFLPQRLAYPVQAPRLPGDLFDRKIQRSVEAQGLRLLHCAARLAPAVQALQLPAARIALSSAIPEVDAPSPCWDAVEAIAEQPDKLLAQLFANTPPLHALTLLNSSVMAYVAEGLGCHGVMGGYCSQGNAGLDALIEALTQISEDRADAALVVSSSPNITPALYLREGVSYPAGQAEAIYGEGAAALLLARSPATASGRVARVAGYARGYSAALGRGEALAERVLWQALSQEKLSLSDIGLIIADPQDPLLARLLGGHGALRSSRPMTGELGASALLSEIGYALGDPAELPPGGHYALLMSRSCAGHYGALVLEIFNPEKGV